MAWNVFVPGALLPALFFFIMYLYPFVERYATGDKRYHHILDRPRNVPTRTGIGVAVMLMGTVLLLAGGDDVIAYRFGIPLYPLVNMLRVGFFALPVPGFFAARYACLALQRRDARRLAAGIPTGVIEELPGGGYAERTRPASEGLRAELETRPPDSIMLPIPRHVIPLPTRPEERDLHALLARLAPIGRTSTCVGELPGRPKTEPVTAIILSASSRFLSQRML